MIELQNSLGQGIPGFSLAESDMVKGNYINKTVSWRLPATAQGHAQHSNSLTALEGRKVAVKIAMTDADLFSISIGCFENR